MRSRKWYMRVFYHSLDLSIINAWLLHRRVCRLRNEKHMPLVDFTAELAETLTRRGKIITPTRGRPLAPTSPPVSKQLPR
ncbi:hypothetical protein M8J76_017243 [Diaphorina citri]|nr:hypothetical protein M8J76_017243 [Diaphorina citri]